MAGRFRDPKGINYPFKIEISKLTPKLHLEIDFDKLIFDGGYDTIVLNHQPGIGKTHSIMNYIVNKIIEDDEFTFFYFTDKHKTIEEHIDKFFSTTQVLHWKGFNRIVSNRNAVNAYYKYHLNIPTIKDIYSVEDNEINQYYAQFQKSKENTRVFSPFNYLYSSNYTNKLNYLDIVFLDENINQMVNYSIDTELTEKVFRRISKNHELWIDKLNSDRGYFLKKGVTKEIIDSYKATAEFALRNKDTTKELLKLLKDFNPYNFKEYIRWGSLYKWKENSYTFPMYFYNAFDAIREEIPIIISDASFNEYLFSYFLESYNGETRNLGIGEGFKDLNVLMLQSKHKNKNTIVYRMHPRGAWSKSSVVGYHKETEKTISDEIKEILRVFGIENVGIIANKAVADKGKLLGLNIEYFNGLRGTNILENKPVLIILGTWLPLPPSDDISKKESINNMVWEHFLIRLDKGDIKEGHATAPQIVYDKFGDIDLAAAHISIDKEFIKSDKLAEIAEKHPISMMNMHFFSEIYQAYHRNRGLRDNKIIFAYGWFPEPEMLINKSIVEPFFRYDLRHEFHIEKEFKSEKLGDILKRYNDIFYRWKGFILDIDNTKIDNTELAKFHHIWRGPGKGPNPKLIGEIRDKIHDKFKKQIGIK